jgi:predicted nuclease of predicted toxin-antitoxin system
MKFLVDAQLPRRIAAWLCEHGHDALHTLDLPDANRTSDAEIIARADREGRVVVTKDSDFVDTFTLHHRPEKLLLITTGNISNRELERILLPNIDIIVRAFETADYIEVTRFGVMAHE